MMRGTPTSGRRFLAGAAVILGFGALLLAVILLFVHFSSWGRFAERFPANDRQSMKAGVIARVVILRDADARRPNSFRDAARVSMAADFIDLELLAPYGLLQESISIPRRSVERCDVSRWSAGTETNLWLADKQGVISISDDDGRILDWCRDSRPVRPTPAP